MYSAKTLGGIFLKITAGSAFSFSDKSIVNMRGNGQLQVVQPFKSKIKIK